MMSERVKLFLREGEGLTIEFKERYTPRIDQDITAFANAKAQFRLLRKLLRSYDTPPVS